MVYVKLIGLQKNKLKLCCFHFTKHIRHYLFLPSYSKNAASQRDARCLSFSTRGALLTRHNNSALALWASWAQPRMGFAAQNSFLSRSFCLRWAAATHDSSAKLSLKGIHAPRTYARIIFLRRNQFRKTFWRTHARSQPAVGQKSIMRLDTAWVERNALIFDPFLSGAPCDLK